MVTASDEFDQYCSYAVPSNTIKQVAPVLIEGEEYVHPWIGLILQSLAITEPAQSVNVKGVAICSIERDGPAHITGLNKKNYVFVEKS
jgi:S1-C subfamily serine protease